MAINYAKAVSKKQTPQSQPIPGSTQVANSAGGFSWKVDNWTQLDRFLILGAEGGTYYIGERDLIKGNHGAVTACIKEDGMRVVKRVIEISDSGRAPKNDPAIFVLALCASEGDAPTQAAAFAATPAVCRIGTHLFHFAAYIDELRGWGHQVRRAFSNWYTKMPADKLAYQAIKYQQRDGWSHADVIKLAHPMTPSEAHNSIFRWMLGKDPAEPRHISRRSKDGKTQKRVDDYAGINIVPEMILAFEAAKKATTVKEVVKLITEKDLPREAIPTQWLNSPEVWDALLVNMPLTAMIRSLAKMTAVGLVKPLSSASHVIIEKLGNETHLKKSRVHPLSILVAERTYAQGKGEKGSLTWSPVQQIVDALDRAFYMTFQNVVPCNKPMLLALDCSASMTWSNVAGMPITPREASGALSLITAATEPNYHIMGFSTGLVDIPISPKMRLTDAVNVIARTGAGGTDCSLPMRWAMDHKADVGGFVVYTDSETWFGDIHPAQALRQYRTQFRHDSRLVVVGMVANQFTIADPSDPGMLDVVGFDTNAPAIISDFVRE